MKFRVTGQNRDSGARMILEFEAESKAAAERKALTSGMSVNRVEDITDGYPAKAHEPYSRSGRTGRRTASLLWILVLIVIIAAAWTYRATIFARLGIHH